MRTLRSLQLGNCVGDEGDCGEADVLFTVTTADAQQILVMIAAAVCVFKSLSSILTNSAYFQISGAVLVLTCTSLAFVLFITEDYQSDFIQQVEAGYGDDIVLYLTAFISAIFVESADIFLVFRAAFTQQLIKTDPSFSMEEYDGFKWGARKLYAMSLLAGLAISGLVPFIAFGKAGWKTASFSPTDFDKDDAKLIMSALLLQLMTHGLMMCATFSPRSMLDPLYSVSLICIAPVVCSGAIMYTTLTRVSGDQSGGLTYLYLISIFQGLGFTAKYFSHIFWLQTGHLGKDSKLDQQIPEQNEI